MSLTTTRHTIDNFGIIDYVYRGESISGFIFAMLVGIVVGTYSSLFIATPVLVDTISAADRSNRKAT
jgi:preprotein translocase subunit SecF